MLPDLITVFADQFFERPACHISRCFVCPDDFKISIKVRDHIEGGIEDQILFIFQFSDSHFSMFHLSYIRRDDLKSLDRASGYEQRVDHIDPAAFTVLSEDLQFIGNHISAPGE